MDSNLGSSGRVCRSLNWLVWRFIPAKVNVCSAAAVLFLLGLFKLNSGNWVEKVDPPLKNPTNFHFRKNNLLSFFFFFETCHCQCIFIFIMCLIIIQEVVVSCSPPSIHNYHLTFIRATALLTREPQPLSAASQRLECLFYKLELSQNQFIDLSYSWVRR